MKWGKARVSCHIQIIAVNFNILFKTGDHTVCYVLDSVEPVRLRGQTTSGSQVCLLSLSATPWVCLVWMREGEGSVAVELFLDLCCPFSRRLLQTVAGQGGGIGPGRKVDGSPYNGPARHGGMSWLAKVVCGACGKARSRTCVKVLIGLLSTMDSKRFARACPQQPANTKMEASVHSRAWREKQVE